MRVVLADDEERVRHALRIVLGRQPDLDVIGEAAQAADLFALLAHTPADLLILDWRLPGFTPAGGLSQLRQYAPDLIIIALSGRPEVGADAHAAGVHAFISKIDPPRTLLDTIQQLPRPGQPDSLNYLSVNQP